MVRQNFILSVASYFHNDLSITWFDIDWYKRK